MYGHLENEVRKIQNGGLKQHSNKKKSHLKKCCQLLWLEGRLFQLAILTLHFMLWMNEWILIPIRHCDLAGSALYCAIVFTNTYFHQNDDRLSKVSPQVHCTGFLYQQLVQYSVPQYLHSTIGFRGHAIPQGHTWSGFVLWPCSQDMF